MSVQRYKLTVAYRGTNYHGWQFQQAASTWKGTMPVTGQGLPTIQQALERALGGVVNHHAVVCGSSRTDAGVHAKGQVAHFDTTALQIPPEGLRRAVNARLPADILIRKIEPVAPDFDAIRWTHSKRYQYCIWSNIDRPVFFNDMAWHRRKPLDPAPMALAARHLIGTHDFTSFARPGHGRGTTTRTLLDCSVHARGSYIVIGVQGTGFLWNMVRIIAGTLTEVGEGKRDPDSFPDILAANNRTAAGRTAPATGLFLQWIRFYDGPKPWPEESAAASIEPADLPED